MLGDSSGFSFGDGGFSKSVEEGGLSVIDVTLKEVEEAKKERRVRTRKGKRMGTERDEFETDHDGNAKREDKRLARESVSGSEAGRERERKEPRLTLVDEEGTSSCWQGSV